MTFGRATCGASRTGRRTAGLAALALVLATGGCDTVGNPFEALGAGIPPPDEFQVIQYEPLVVPGSYELPEPQPGARSPRAPDPDRQAKAALLGPGAVAAEAAGPSAGERVLLSSANAASASENIRIELEEERTRAAARDEYEAPLIWELFGFGGDDATEDVDESELVDPVAEAERLRRAGIATPVDPEAEARAAEEQETEREPLVVQPGSATKGGGRPQLQF